MKKITSTQNSLIKQVCSLKSAKGRKEIGLFLAEGTRTIEAIVGAGIKPVYLFCTAELSGFAPSIAPNGIEVPDHVMAKISSFSAPPGILGVFSIPKPIKPLESGTVLAQISDPGNMGTLIRSAAAMGKKTVVVVEGADPWSPKVVQASAGTIALVDIYQLSWHDLLVKKGDLKLCAMVVEKGADIKTLNLKKSLIVVGSEAHGLPQEWTDSCEYKVTLSMPGNTESLNAAVAGSIALYLSNN